MKKLIALSAALLSFSVAAEPIKWSNVYTDYVNDKSFTKNSTDEHLVAGMEGGFIGESLNFYGFTEQDVTDDTNFTKLTGHYSVAKDITAYAQGTYFAANGDSNETVLIGLGYEGLTGNNFSLKPFMGANYVGADDKLYFTMGWTAHYEVNNKLYVTHWNESTVYSGVNAQGDVGLYYKLPFRFYTGVQYRYSYNANGVDGYDDNIGVRIGFSM